jgi:putative transposase
VSADREEVMRIVAEAVEAGARQCQACEIVGLDVRTYQRWSLQGPGEDGRMGPKTEPANKLSVLERERIVQVATSLEFRDLSPKQIVPRLADRDEYVGSESSFYRVLRAEDAMKHRSPAKRPAAVAPREHVATGPGQVWSWDITYLRSAVRGSFHYLYLIEDVWSRKIVGWAVHEEEAMEHSSVLIDEVTARSRINARKLVLHSDNGGPMKGSTMLATLQRLGIVASFSRPSVSDDNPYSEALFRTLKYRPEYPQRAFASLEEAQAWVAWFVDWYNEEHLHSAIGFVSPAQRHDGADVSILANRKVVYEKALRRHPERWSGEVRNWERVEVVRLNPSDAAAASRVPQDIAA